MRSREYFIPKICIAAINAQKFNLRTAFGNLNISREWNWCEEQVKYLLCFIEKYPQDFILSNGKSYSAKQMIGFAFQYFNLDYKKFIKEYEEYKNLSDWDKKNILPDIIKFLQEEKQKVEAEENKTVDVKVEEKVTKAIEEKKLAVFDSFIKSLK